MPGSSEINQTLVTGIPGSPVLGLLPYLHDLTSIITASKARCDPYCHSYAGPNQM